MTDKTKALVEALIECKAYAPEEIESIADEALAAFEQSETPLGNAWEQFKYVNDERLRKLESGFDLNDAIEK